MMVMNPHLGYILCLPLDQPALGFPYSGARGLLVTARSFVT